MPSAPQTDVQAWRKDRPVREVIQWRDTSEWECHISIESKVLFPRSALRLANNKVFVWDYTKSTCEQGSSGIGQWTRDIWVVYETSRASDAIVICASFLARTRQETVWVLTDPACKAVHPLFLRFRHPVLTGESLSLLPDNRVHSADRWENIPAFPDDWPVPHHSLESGSPRIPRTSGGLRVGQTCSRYSNPPS